MDVADFAQDGSPRDRPNARDGGDVLGDLFHQLGHGIVKLGNLLLKEVNLLQQAVHLDARSIDQEAYADRLSSRVVNAPQYLLRLSRQGRLDTRFREMPLKVLYHNPCHLKVQGIRRESVALLELIPGISVSAVVDNCCGMGGSYGMKAAHYDMSVKIARKLWADIEDAEVDTIVTECGTCMLQIEARQDTKKAVHPMLLTA